MSTVLPSASAIPLVMSGTAVTPPVPVKVATPAPSRRIQRFERERRGAELRRRTERRIRVGPAQLQRRVERGRHAVHDHRDGVAGRELAVVGRQRQHVRARRREAHVRAGRRRIGEGRHARSARLAPLNRQRRARVDAVVVHHAGERAGRGQRHRAIRAGVNCRRRVDRPSTAPACRAAPSPSPCPAASRTGHAPVESATRPQQSLKLQRASSPLPVGNLAIGAGAPSAPACARNSRCAFHPASPAKKPAAAPVEFSAVPSAAVLNAVGARRLPHDHRRTVRHAVHIQLQRRAVVGHGRVIPRVHQDLGRAADRVIQAGARARRAFFEVRRDHGRRAAVLIPRK